MRARRLIARLAAVVLTTASAGLVLAATGVPAQAAACSDSGGVTVVVDPHQLGGPIAQQCAGNNGATASAMFTSTGFSLTRVQQQPGFICRINGAPADDPCVRTPPASAYWSLWWTDGTSSSWTYSALGADSLRVPAGGTVAFSWNQGSGNIPPGVAPAVRAGGSAPSPAAPPSTSAGSGSTGGTPSGTRSGSDGSAGSKSSPAKPKASSKPVARPAPASPSAPTSEPAPAKATPSNSPSPSADESVAPTESPAAAESSAPGAGKAKRDKAAGSKPEPAVPSASVETAPEDDPTSSAPAIIETDTTPTSAVTDPGGLPAWVVPGLLVVLLGAAGATAAVRRRHAATD